MFVKIPNNNCVYIVHLLCIIYIFFNLVEKAGPKFQFLCSKILELMLSY